MPEELHNDEGRGLVADGDSTDPTSAELMRELAVSSQERHERTREEAQQVPPEFILSVERTDVVYTFPLRLLPLAHIDYGNFCALLAKKWGLSPSLADVKLDPTELRTIPQDEHFDENLMNHVLRSSNPQVAFTGGRYRLSSTEFVPINSVMVNRESVVVSVSGVTRVAEAVAQETAEAVSAMAGATPSWSTLEKEVLVLGYTTQTRVDLGGESAFERLLSAKFRAFLEEEVTSGPRYGAHIGTYRARHGLKPPPRAVLSAALDDLVLYITRYDPDTHTAINSRLRFSVVSVNDYGSGIVSVTSELPYEVHVECLHHLISATEDS